MKVDVKIHALGDPVPLFPELNGKAIVHGSIIHCGILEHGMQDGRTSVGFDILMPDGSYCFAEMSAAMFLTIGSAVRGAVERFEDAGRN